MNYIGVKEFREMKPENRELLFQKIEYWLLTNARKRQQLTALEREAVKSLDVALFIIEKVTSTSRFKTKLGSKLL